MSYAVELLLDDSTAEAVRALWRRLAEAGIPCPLLEMGVSPHVTVAVYEDLDPFRLHDALSSFASEETPEPIALAGAGSFPGEEGVAFLTPVVTRGLLALHAGFHERFAELRERAFPHYLPGSWVPHVTIALHLSNEERARALQIACDSDLPLHGHLDRLELLEFERGVLRPVHELYALPLGN